MIDLAERFLDYGARIVKLTVATPPTLIGRIVRNQLLRSGTGVGANYEEARAAESERLDGLVDESTQLRAILSKAVATAKGTQKEVAVP